MNKPKNPIHGGFEMKRAYFQSLPAALRFVRGFPAGEVVRVVEFRKKGYKELRKRGYKVFWGSF